MDIDTVIERLQELKDKGATRVFLHDATNDMVLDLIEIETDSDGDVLMCGD